MFGYVAASVDELTEDQKQRWGSVYCGICAALGKQSGFVSRVVLRYDCAFLALLLMSLYEPPEALTPGRCIAHPLSQKPRLSCQAVDYAAAMNLALGYYKALDDSADEGKLSAKALCKALKKPLAGVESAYGRQCAAIKSTLAELSRLEKEDCADADACAACFGRLLGEVFVWKQDRWADTLYRLGFSLGRFIYLADCHCDLERDRKSGAFNPYLRQSFSPTQRKSHLVMAMAAAMGAYEQLPLVRDKEILDNIIYSGVWLRIREENHA